MTCTPSHPTAEVRRQSRSERNLFAGFPWLFYAIVILTFIVATGLGFALAIHLTHRTLQDVQQASERAKY